MDKQTLSNLIEQSKKGNQKAMEQLLIYAHTPVSYQCRRLLNDPQLAEGMTERILKSLASQIEKIESADHFYKWLGNATAARCMRKREQAGIKEYISDTKNVSFPSNELSKAETAQVAQILADSLPEEYRICLLLSSCCRVGTKAIAQMTGFAEETVTKYIAEAELGIREQMQVYQNQGVVFAGSLSVAALLRNAMFLDKNRSAAAAMSRKVLPPVPAAPVQPPKRPNNIVKVLLCVAIALVLLLMLLIWGVIRNKSAQEAEETTLPTTTATTAVSETTEATTEPTTQPTTEPTTEETTLPETTEAIETTQATEVPETTAPKPTSTPVTNTGSTASNSTPKPTESSDYNPGQGEDGHTHDYFTRPSGQNATCTKAAQIYRLCSICKKGIITDDPDNPPLGHDYQVNAVVQPTTTSKGYTNYRCTRCGDSYDADYVDPLPAPTQPPVVETQPPVVETQPPMIETQAPVVESQLPVSDSGEQNSDLQSDA